MPLSLKRKICLLGDGAVGKTSLIRRFVVDKYDDKYIATLGTKVSKKTISIREPARAEITLMIWDVLGQKEFKRIQTAAFHGTKGAMIVCDMTRAETYQSLGEWRSRLFEVTGEVPTILLANKADLVDQAQIAEKEMAAAANAFNSPYYLTSAKTGLNVENAFTTMAAEILKRGGTDDEE